MALTPVPPRFDRLLGWIPFVGSAALVATAIDVAVKRPAVGVVLFEIALVLFVPQLLQRRKLRRVLRSGDVNAVLSAWESSAERVPHPETMAPLITATALAAHGLTDRARRALSLARRGPAWEAAIEQRLVVDTLLSVFDGEPDRALRTADELLHLPLPPSPLLRARVRSLRGALGAFARAFAHTSDARDSRVLEDAAIENPLVYWALRYAAAVASLDHGERTRALTLLDGAPRWPRDSVFAAFHDEIAAHARGGG